MYLYFLCCDNTQASLLYIMLLENIQEVLSCCEVSVLVFFLNSDSRLLQSIHHPQLHRKSCPVPEEGERRERSAIQCVEDPPRRGQVQLPGGMSWPCSSGTWCWSMPRLLSLWVVCMAVERSHWYIHTLHSKMCFTATGTSDFDSL